MAAARYWPLVSFVSGHLSRLLRGRVDIAQYRQGCQTLVNFQPMVQGGVKRRPGTELKANAYLNSGRCRLIPFVASDGSAYMVEFTSLLIRIHDDAGVASPVDIVAPWTQPQLVDLDWAHAEDTMVLVHPEITPYRLVRFADGTWMLGTIPFFPAPTAENANWYQSTQFTPGSTGTGTVTFTGTLYASDVGRVIRRGAGYGTVASIGSGTFDVTVTRGFTASTAPFVLEGSPLMTMTPQDDGPVGQTITMTGSLAWQTSGAGRVVRLHGGSVLLTDNVSATVMNGIILEELSATTTVPARGWTMEYPEWGTWRGYPRTVTFHEQRLLFGGWKAKPQGIAASGIGLFYDFRRSELATDAFTYELVSKSQNSIEYLTSDDDLVAMTVGAEIALRASAETAMSATNPPMSKRQSNNGTRRIRPVEVDGELVFVAADGRRVMSMAYDGAAGRYAVTDISVLAEDLFESPVIDLAFGRMPIPTIFCVLASGKVACCTYNRAQGVTAWWLMETDGTVEAVGVAAGDAQDSIWLQTVRTGTPVRYVEKFRPDEYTQMLPRFNQLYEGRTGLQTDCTSIRYPAGITTSISGLTAKASLNMRVLADGYDAGLIAVSAGGVLTLPQGAEFVHVGYAYTSTLEPMPAELATPQGAGQGRPSHPGPGFLKLDRSIGGKIDGDPIVPALVWPAGAYNETEVLTFTGERDFQQAGWTRDQPPVTVVQDAPYPFTVLYYGTRIANSP